MHMCKVSQDTFYLYGVELGVSFKWILSETFNPILPWYLYIRYAIDIA
jgi:hypothetical protein